jgi:hypothetical protein
MKFKLLKLLSICLFCLLSIGVLSSSLLLTNCGKKETSIVITNTPNDICGRVSVDYVTSYTTLTCQNNKGEIVSANYSVLVELPTGLQINEETGVISGTATEECNDTYTIQASYYGFIAEVSLRILINTDPSNYVGNDDGTN